MPIRIRSLSTTDGYLQNACCDFADGLTCVIGARGTCKSTLVETIRFVFDCDPERVKQVLLADPGRPATDSPTTHGLIRVTLGAGVAKCEVVDEDDPAGPCQIAVERDIDAPPRVYRDGVKELSDHSILHHVEIYSQGDLQRIAEDDALRLDLIDRPNKVTISQLKTDRLRYCKELKDVGERIRSVRSAIESRRADVRALESLRQQLSELQSQRPTLSQEFDAQRESFLRRKAILERLRTGMELRETVLASFLETTALSSNFESLADELRDADVPEARTLIEHIHAFQSLVEQVRSSCVAQQEVDLSPLITAIDRAFEERNAEYYKMRKEQEELHDSLKREDSIKQNILHLEKLEREMRQFLTEEERLRGRRQQLRQLKDDIADRIFRLRLQEVDQINATHGDVVCLTLGQGTRSADYQDRLSSLLQGSRIRNQEEVASDLAHHVRPPDLIDMVEAADARRLADVLGRDIGQMTRLVTFLMDNERLYELEGIAFEDQLEITMYDGAVPKSVNQLSKGQKATALLPLILRPADYPLIFDQPEDDLDNRFIYTTLVERVRQLRLQRQLIFVTHNANIPVLGDADSVVVMTMQSPTKAAPPRVGTVDDARAEILTLLEGGAEAFKRRLRRYGTLLE